MPVKIQHAKVLPIEFIYIISMPYITTLTLRQRIDCGQKVTPRNLARLIGRAHKFIIGGATLQRGIVHFQP